MEILVEVEEYLVDADNKGMVAGSSSGVSPSFWITKETKLVDVKAQQK